MANVTLNAGSGGATVRTVDHTSVSTQIVALDLNPAGAETLMAGTMPCTQSGAWTVTANAGTGTFDVSAASLPLPSGASTAAKQPALGTAGSASTDVLTVQGIASMTAVKVDGSSVTQPVSGTVTANAGTGTFTVSGAVTQSGTWNVVNSAGTNLIGTISSSNETTTVYSGTTALTPKFAAIAASSSGDNSVVPLVSGKKIRVLRWSVSGSGTVNIKWRNGTTDITGLYYLVANATVGGGYCPVGHFETSSGAALQINLSGATAVGGVLTYIEV